MLILAQRASEGYHSDVKYRLRRGKTKKSFDTPYAKPEKYDKINAISFGIHRRFPIMAKPVYKRVLLKISGEALGGDKGTGLDFLRCGEP